MNQRAKSSLKITFLVLLIVTFLLMVILPLTIGVTWDVKYKAIGNAYNVYYGYLDAKFRPWWYMHKTAYDGKIIYDSVLMPLYIVCTLMCGLSMVAASSSFFIRNKWRERDLLVASFILLCVSFAVFNIFAGLVPKRTNGANNYWTENDNYRLKEYISDLIEDFCKKELDPTADMLSHPRWSTIKIYNLSVSKSSISIVTIFIPDFFLGILILAPTSILIWKLWKGNKYEKTIKFNGINRSNSRTY